MAVLSRNIKTLLLAGIVCLLWGGYNVAMATYYSFNWNEVEGIVVDFERHTMTCGKGIGECYSLLVGYHAGTDYFITNSKKTFSRNKPAHLFEEKVVVYYSPENSSEAILGGEYGPFRFGTMGVFLGFALLLIYWLVRNRE